MFDRGQMLAVVYQEGPYWWIGRPTHIRLGPYKSEEQARLTAEYIHKKEASTNDESKMPPMR